tara:strand:+ start:4593 stop:5408 length:816 start_codon:yes stop_codon:yes gene_type:complete
MINRLFLIFFLVFFSSCSKKDPIYEPTSKLDPYALYQEGMSAFDKNDFFFASKKFSEAELNFDKIELAAKSSIMSSFCLYSINFYNEAIDNLKTYLKNYPADKNVIYARYLIAIIYFEQISDEKKDLDPLIKAKSEIEFFIKKYPDTDYSIDLKFKKDLILNQLAAKEIYVAKFYISTQKWIPAINRLKIIVKDYDKTIFIEEALHRLVEIHYHLGLEDEAKKYAQILGYNYNSSEWFKQSYKILNKNYDFKSKKIVEKESLLKKIIKIIK